MNCLMVVAHPLDNSLCKFLAQKSVEHLESKGYQVTVKDLYREEFNPVLTTSERKSYYGPQFDSEALGQDLAQLKNAQSLVILFPTWWFGFPAILKGWFDRVWAPGYAYQHAADFGPIAPKLTHLKEVKVITTLGSPWWVDFFILRRPVRRILKTALVGTCTKNCSFTMLSLYSSERLTQSKVENFVRKIEKKL
ncbi:NAD(P)H-dependent oxidoreductase [Sessilibacter sp. MAH2]